jgi:microcompartment protein CcmK/EutM
MIYWARGREASIAFLPEQPPADATIVGIVDSVHRAAVKPPKPERHRAERH